MRVYNDNYNRYDSTVNNNQKTEQARPTNRVKTFQEAFRLDLSSRALSSKEYNDPSINFPTHNADVLEYTNNLGLIFKP